MRYISWEESLRLRLDRKRRMRLIYKWRHGLERTHQPLHRDRGKLRLLVDIDAMKLDPIAERILGPVIKYWETIVAERIMG